MNILCHVAGSCAPRAPGPQLLFKAIASFSASRRVMLSITSLQMFSAPEISMARLFRIMPLAALSATTLLYLPAYGADTWILPRDKFDCIVDNLDKYSGQPKDPVMIFVGDCPLTDIATIMSRRTVNTLPEPNRKAAPLPWDEVMVVRKKELACLRGSGKPHAEGLVAVPKLPCG